MEASNPSTSARSAASHSTAKQTQTTPTRSDSSRDVAGKVKRVVIEDSFADAVTYQEESTTDTKQESKDEIIARLE